MIVRVSRQYAVPAEQAFDAWLDPQLACRFLFATPGGEMVRTTIDARVGGSLLIVEKREGVHVEHVGIFLEIARPRRLSFLFSVPYYGQASSRVSVAVLRMENGCEVVVSHDGVAEELVEKTEAGWRGILEGLNAVLAPCATPVAQV